MLIKQALDAPQPITGTVVRVAGPVVTAEGLGGVRMYDVVHVGHLRLVGEVIRLAGAQATIQVYEDTSGLRVGEPVTSSGGPFMVELGPGLLGAIFDGVQRPLPVLHQRQGDYIARGSTALALDCQKAWDFVPRLRVGECVVAGDVLGVVQETPYLAHRVLVPPEVSGIVDEIGSGQYTVEQTVAVVRAATQVHQVTLVQRWPARQPRPHCGKLDPTAPLVTGQRVMDAFFPLAKGGTAIIPGGFGTGKTVIEQRSGRWPGSGPGLCWHARPGSGAHHSPLHGRRGPPWRIAGAVGPGLQRGWGAR